MHFFYLLFLGIFPLQLFCLEKEMYIPQKKYIDCLLADQHEPDLSQVNSTRYFFNQWFTGPLLMPSPVTPSPKNPTVQFNWTLFDTYGQYDENWRLHTSGPNTWSILYLPYAQIGITKHFGLDVFSALKQSYSQHHSATFFTDTVMRFGYQILTDQHQKGDLTPDLRLMFQETFPTGNYQKLNPGKNLLDATGQGVFQSGFYLAGQKGFNWSTNHAFNLCFALGYFIPTSVKVQGVNYYGGNADTSGRVYPGSVFSVYFSGEVELTRHIAFAFDSNYQQTLSGHFNGRVGGPNPINTSQSVTFQFAPELEIIISQHAGLIFGPWFTFAGQNSPAFISFSVNFLYLF